jgi:integrase
MREVEAVKTEADITTIHTLLNKHGSGDFADIWKLGINVALRISDLLAIEVDQINLDRREVEVRESKTGKRRIIRLNKPAMEIIQTRMVGYPSDKYLFQSHGNRARSANQPLDRSSVARKFQEIGSIVDIRLGTHSMRKTRGYMLHKAGVSIEQISRVLNHSSPAVTMHYIGLTQEETLQTYDDFEL